MEIERQDPYLKQVLSAIDHRNETVSDYLTRVGHAYSDSPPSDINVASSAPTQGPTDSLPVVVELTPGANVSALGQVSGFRVETVMEPWVTGWTGRSALDALNEHPNVSRIILSREGGRASATVPPPPDPLEATNVRPLQQGHPGEYGENVVAGVIDLGLEIVHETFLDDDGKTRLIAVWDQWGSGPPPKGYSYGRYYSQADIEALVSGPHQSPSHQIGRDPHHGTNVTSIFAGRAVQNAAGDDFLGGVAEKATIVFVAAKIDSEKDVDPKSVGYSKSHIDALSFIEREAGGRPLVINMSSGMNAGAHDGTSPLELAFDRFTQGGTTPGRAIVKSIGNERYSDLHARLYTITDGTNHFEWHSSSEVRWQDYIELWFPSTDRHEFTLISPSGERVGPVRWAPKQREAKKRLMDSNAGPPAAGREFVQMTLSPFHRDNGDSQLILTIQESPSYAIRSGEWQLEVHSTQVVSNGVIDAWIETISDRKPIKFTSNTVTEVTLSIPATARSIITVGAVDSKLPAMPYRFSSLGPTRDNREKPDVVAPGQRFVAADAGSRNATVVVEGTSMASPIVAGALALAMSKRSRLGGPMWNAAQLRAALRQTARGYSGFWNTHFGCGVVSAEKLLDVLE